MSRIDWLISPLPRPLWLSICFLIGQFGLHFLFEDADDIQSERFSRAAASSESVFIPQKRRGF